MTELQILYETEDFMFVYKPPYQVCDSVRDFSEYLDTELPDNMKCFQFIINIIKYIKQQGNVIGPEYQNGLCHRFDYQTSGILMITKKPEKFMTCRHMISDKEKTIKIYCCLVNGIIDKKSGFIINRIYNPSTDKNNNVLETSNDLKNKSLGMMSASYYQVIKEYEYNGNYYSYVFVRLFTGKKHQIRLHMKSLGTPIVGDRAYNIQENYEQNMDISRRMFLHNFKLCVVLDNQQICLTAKLPNELKESLNKLTQINSYEIQELDKLKSPLTKKDMMTTSKKFKYFS